MARGRALVLIFGFVHPKNLRGFELLCSAAGLELEVARNGAFDNRAAWELVWIPEGFIHPITFPAARRIVYGPHNFVVPEGLWLTTDVRDPRAVYTCLSDWNLRICSEKGGAAGMKLAALPFPVDVKAFRCADGGEKSLDCFLYWKGRNEADVACVEKLLKHLGLRYELVRYGSYKEEDYKNVLTRAKFGVVVDAHESQGFAVEEALSSGVPLLVWGVQTLGEEIGRDGKVVYTGDTGSRPASTVPYWDARCGEVVLKRELLAPALMRMVRAWRNYRPREFIMETLGPEACWRRWREALGLGRGGG
jgi:hypothetical protein